MAEFIRQEKQDSKNNCSKAESDMQDSSHAKYYRYAST